MSTTTNEPQQQHINPKPNELIEHTTTIDAPIDAVWWEVFDVNDWRWNKWFKLEAGIPVTGLKGTLRVCLEGDNKDWKTYEFEFADVDNDRYIMAWKGEVGPFGGCIFRGYHTVKLEKITATQTRLIHTEIFGGILPYLKLGFHYPTIDRNYRFFNEALKEHVEVLNKTMLDQ